jgi:AcrR family transcriptional regulator
MNQRDKIIDAAASVFSRDGYHKTKMDDIATQAGVAKGTLYYHFPGKADLFRTLATEGLEMLLGETRAALDVEAPFREQIRLVISRTIHLYLSYGELAKILFNEITSGLDAAVYADIQSVREKFRSFLANLIEEGTANGFIRVANADLAAAGLIGMLDGMCRLSLNHPDLHTSAQVEETMLALLVSGMVPEKSAKGGI